MYSPLQIVTLSLLTPAGGYFTSVYPFRLLLPLFTLADGSPIPGLLLQGGFLLPVTLKVILPPLHTFTSTGVLSPLITPADASPEGVCTDEFLLRKPGFLLSAMHSHSFRWFSAAPLDFLFLGLLPLQLYQIWRIFCVKYGEECGWTLFVWLQKLYLTDMFEWLLSYIQL
jgi:hypothetical protein